jgi:hypothetical protein
MRLFSSLITSLALTSALASSGAQAQTSGPVYLDQMTSQYNQGKLAAAEQTGLSLLRSEPSNLAVHYLLASIYARTARLERAVQEYNYCLKFGNGSQIGVFATQGLAQIRRGAQLQSQASSGETGESTSPQAPPQAPQAVFPQAQQTQQAQIAADKIDLEMLEYKERLLKTGADLIAANRAKLQRQIQSLQNQTDGIIDTMTSSASTQRGGSNQLEIEKNRLEQDTANKIQQLRENNAAEELKITAFYKGQVEAIGAQKGDLGSQMEAHGKASARISNDANAGNVRMVERGSGLFVRNYINYHGEMPLPPLPPELHALAQKLTDTSQTANLSKNSVGSGKPHRTKAGKLH